MASASLSPKSFGMVIPENGVLDLLAKDRLDARYDGWSFEYGSTKESADLTHLKKYSPVENASTLKDGPFVLVVNGANDSRVNSAHSYKLQAALQSAGASSLLISLKNSGHRVSVYGSVNTIAWRANSQVWSLIYDHIGKTALEVVSQKKAQQAP